MKIFVSSVIAGYERFREAAQDAIETLGHEVVRAEDFNASSSSPRVACLAGVREADLVVLLLGARYGAVQKSGKSATHEEFDEARDRKEILAFVEDVNEREDRQASFVKLVQDWQGGVFTEPYRTPDELRKRLIRALHQYAVHSVRGGGSTSEIMERAKSLMRDVEGEWYGHRPSIAVVLSGNPGSQLIRPAELHGPELDREVFRLLTRNPEGLFNARERTEKEVTQDSLINRQTGRGVSLHADGSIVAKVSLEMPDSQMAVVEEDVASSIERILQNSVDILACVDPLERLPRVGVMATLCDASYVGWLRRDQLHRHRGGMTIKMQVDKEPVSLKPPIVRRAALRTSAGDIAKDLTVLLRYRYS